MTRWAVALAFGILAAMPPAFPVASAFQIVLDTDGFDGVDGTDLPTYNANWVNQDGGHNPCRIRGTTAVGGVLGANNRTGVTWPNNQWAELTFTTTLPSGYAYICVRCQTDNTYSGYFAGVDPGLIGNNKYEISRYTSNTRTQLAQSATQAVLGDVFNLEVIGTILRLRVNGAVLLTYDTASDGTKYASGRPGLSINTSGTSVVADSWRAGSAAPDVVPSTQTKRPRGSGR
jgi:hypothetical protein